MGKSGFVRQKQIENTVARIIRDNAGQKVKPPSHQAYYHWQRRGKIPKPSIPLDRRAFGYTGSEAIDVIEHALHSKKVPAPHRSDIQNLISRSEVQLQLFTGGTKKMPINEFVNNAKASLSKLAETGGVLVLTDPINRPAFRISKARRSAE